MKMRCTGARARGALGFLHTAILAVALPLSGQAFELDRTSLPIAEPERPKYKELDVRNVETPPLFKVEAPAGTLTEGNPPRLAGTATSIHR